MPKLSARSKPARRGSVDGAHSAAPPYAASTCSHRPWSAQTSAMASSSSTAPALVEPKLPTTANSPPVPASAIVARSAVPVIRPRSSVGTSSTSTSITRAAACTEACDSSVAAKDHRPGGSPRSSRARWRAATSADRFAAVPPVTKQPPAPSGKPARPASQSRVWFSAAIAPAPLSQYPPKMLDAARRPGRTCWLLASVRWRRRRGGGARPSDGRRASRRRGTTSARRDPRCPRGGRRRRGPRPAARPAGRPTSDPSDILRRSMA